MIDIYLNNNFNKIVQYKYIIIKEFSKRTTVITNVYKKLIIINENLSFQQLSGLELHVRSGLDWKKGFYFKDGGYQYVSDHIDIKNWWKSSRGGGVSELGTMSENRVFSFLKSSLNIRKFFFFLNQEIRLEVRCRTRKPSHNSLKPRIETRYLTPGRFLVMAWYFRFLLFWVSP